MVTGTPTAEALRRTAEVQRHATPALARRLVAWMPDGRLLPEQEWAKRHRLIIRFALVQAVGVWGFGRLQGETSTVCLIFLGLVALPALLAVPRAIPRRTRTLAATVSLMVASAAVVDLAHGVAVAHFHFFVMLGIVALYQDRVAFAVCGVITVLHHGVLGTVDPSVVYGSSPEGHHPVIWALVIGGFVAAASVTHLIAWKANENQELVDALTYLPNRTAFIERLQSELSATDAPLSVCFVDLDNFKHVNDSAGHHVGDRVLVHAAKRMTEATRAGDLVARLAGDEFAVFVRGNAARAEAVGARVVANLAEPVLIDGREYKVHASVGVADTLLARSRHADDILRDADLAMYLAKSSGRNRVVTYTAGVDRAVRERAELASDLRLAMAARQLTVHYQPIMSGGDTMVAVEALLRWQHPGLGLVAPTDFIPIAEETGEIRPIGAWVLRTAAAQVVAWQRAVQGCEHLRLAVNLSPVQLRDEDLVDTVSSTLRATALRPQDLTLEVTESAILLNLELARRHLDALRDLGVRVAIDDFGTGYSSLSYLSTLPVDSIKIDRSFVSNLSGGTGSYLLVKAVIDLARALGLETVAEGVERADQQRLLADLGCTYSQGFLFSPAMKLGELPRFVAMRSAPPAAPPPDPTAVVASRPLRNGRPRTSPR